MNLVLFDLDNTLLAGDSDYEWGQFLIAKGAVDGAHYEAKNKSFYEDYKAGQLDIYAFLAFALRPLATHSRVQLEAWRTEYMETRIKPMMTPAARDLVKRHLDEADLVAVITATNSFVTAPIAREFGISHLIATGGICLGDGPSDTGLTSMGRKLLRYLVAGLMPMLASHIYGSAYIRSQMPLRSTTVNCL